MIPGRAANILFERQLGLDPEEEFSPIWLGFILRSGGGSFISFDLSDQDLGKDRPKATFQDEAHCHFYLIAIRAEGHRDSSNS